MAKEISYTLEGLVPSKKNKVRHRAGGGGYYEDDTRREIDFLVMQLRCKRPRLPLEGNMEIYTEITTPRRQDSDNMHTTILDCLQTAEIIKNDKDVSEGRYKRIIDPECKNGLVHIVIKFI